MFRSVRRCGNIPVIGKCKRYVNQKVFILRAYLSTLMCFILQYLGCLRYKPRLPNISMSGIYNDDFTLCLLKLGYVLSPVILLSPSTRHKHLPPNIDMTLGAFGLVQVIGLTHEQILELICRSVRNCEKVYCHGTGSNTKVKVKLT